MNIDDTLKCEDRMFQYKKNGSQLHKECPRRIRFNSVKIYIGDNACIECPHFAMRTDENVFCMNWEIEND